MLTGTIVGLSENAVRAISEMDKLNGRQRVLTALKTSFWQKYTTFLRGLVWKVNNVKQSTAWRSCWIHWSLQIMVDFHPLAFSFSMFYYQS